MIIKSSIFLAIFLSLTNFCYGSGEWIPVNQPNIIVQQTVPPINILVEQAPQPIILYQWTPHVVVEPVVVTKKRIFVQEQTIQMIPVTKWVYQPVVVYR